MLLEASVGDAYGGGFEYVSEEIVGEFGNALEYRAHPKHKQITPGKYTDDTQMALAICEAMIQNDPWTPQSLADRFVDVFKRDERTGYSRRLYGILTAVKDGTELLATIKGTSDRSGAAMRAFPIGLYADQGKVIERTVIQAKITHDTPLGIAAAKASALMTHFFCYRLGKKADLFEYINTHVESPEGMTPWTELYGRRKVEAQGWMSVKAAMQAVFYSNTITECLKACIAFTGDVDTVATIALAAASFSDEHDQDLPQSLIDGLEDSKYGRQYIQFLDNHLEARTVRK
jgi:ADP-ribosyl-[dinitrogen reductase] hydrolase